MNTLTLLAFALFSATLIGPALADGVIDNKGDLLFTKNTTVVGNDRALERYRQWHWYELNDDQYAKLVATLRGIKASKSVNVECGDADCRPLAEDLVDALNEAGWKAELISHYFLYRDIPVGNGLSCDGAFLCAAITSSTGIKTKPYVGPPENFTLVFGPKK